MAELNDLSEREIEILRLVATGASNKEIADKLVISTNTVKVHLRNIFSKLEASSRTEVTLWAVRNGLMPAVDEALNPSTLDEEDKTEADLDPNRIPESVLPSKTLLRRILSAFVVIIATFALILIGFYAARGFSSPQTTPTQSVIVNPQPVIQEGWLEKSPLPEARSGMAVASYANSFFAIGGQTTDQVVGLNLRYEPNNDSWTNLSPKPVPVKDAQAAVIGGKIYIPGGETASGENTDILEIYDPRTDAWELGASLPIPVSAYALTAYEGRLYLFGGWDGNGFLSESYSYEPDQNVWVAISPLPTPRAYATAAVALGKIHVMGGVAGDQPLRVNELYDPIAEGSAYSPWTAASPLPVGRSAFGAVSIANIIYIIGGYGDDASQAAYSYEYLAVSGVWQPFPAPFDGFWPEIGLANVGTDLYALGGLENSQPVNHNLSYKALYTVVIPILPK